jgi:hypothetical protein
LPPGKRLIVSRIMGEELSPMPLLGTPHMAMFTKRFTANDRTFSIKSTFSICRTIHGAHGIGARVTMALTLCDDDVDCMYPQLLQRQGCVCVCFGV